MPIAFPSCEDAPDVFEALPPDAKALWPEIKKFAETRGPSANDPLVRSRDPLLRALQSTDGLIRNAQENGMNGERNLHQIQMYLQAIHDLMHGQCDD